MKVLTFGVHWGERMKGLEKGIHGLTTILQWGALSAIFLMMALIFISVIMRALFNSPIIGDYELVQLLMVTLIGLGVAYAESIDGHIKVGLLVDRFPVKVQTVVDIIVSLIIAAVCLVVGITQYKAGIRGMTTLPVSTSLLHIPHYPFQFLLCIGFCLWALEAFLKAVMRTISLFTRDSQQSAAGEGKMNAF